MFEHLSRYAVAVATLGVCRYKIMWAVHKPRLQAWGRGGSQQYYISLCSKHVKEGEGGIKNPQNPVNVGYE